MRETQTQALQKLKNDYAEQVERLKAAFIANNPQCDIAMQHHHIDYRGRLRTGLTKDILLAQAESKIRDIIPPIPDNPFPFMFASTDAGRVVLGQGTFATVSFSFFHILLDW